MIHHHGNAQALVAAILERELGARLLRVERVDRAGKPDETSRTARVFVQTRTGNTVFRYTLPCSEADLRTAAVRAVEPEPAWKDPATHWKRGE